jgi:hypothetical protein
MQQQLWGYKVEGKVYLGAREGKSSMSLLYTHYTSALKLVLMLVTLYWVCKSSE